MVRTAGAGGRTARLAAGVLRGQRPGRRALTQGPHSGQHRPQRAPTTPPARANFTLHPRPHPWETRIMCARVCVHAHVHTHTHVCTHVLRCSTTPLTRSVPTGRRATTEAPPTCRRSSSSQTGHGGWGEALVHPEGVTVGSRVGGGSGNSPESAEGTSQGLSLASVAGNQRSIDPNIPGEEGPPHATCTRTWRATKKPLAGEGWMDLVPHNRPWDYTVRRPSRTEDTANVWGTDTPRDPDLFAL